MSAPAWKQQYNIEMKQRKSVLLFVIFVRSCRSGGGGGGGGVWALLAFLGVSIVAEKGRSNPHETHNTKWQRCMKQGNGRERISVAVV